MSPRTILVTGGAGFVGSSIALFLKQAMHEVDVVALDNLKRRGSELALTRLASGGVRFVHGDARILSDIEGSIDAELVIDCAAEPSVLAGLNGSPQYVIDTNLGGTLNTLEYCRHRGAGLIFVSTSRVYPFTRLKQLPLRIDENRYSVDTSTTVPGIRDGGVLEEFPLEGARSIYGASKLSSEIMIREYVEAYQLNAVINRCGVLTGPWQMGKTDQGIVVYWLLSHHLQRPLRYIGFGGNGYQVRDILHVQDLASLVHKQIEQLETTRYGIFNVGGGLDSSVSLRELTGRCRELTGTSFEIGHDPEDRQGDIPYFVTNCDRVKAAFDWAPECGLDTLLADTNEWVVEYRDALEKII
jgi:CDP-paratose 2-epimerase